MGGEEHSYSGALTLRGIVTRAACLWRDGIKVDAQGTIAVPEGPGLGCEPDQSVMEAYRVN